MRRHLVRWLEAVLLLRHPGAAGSEADRERQPMNEWGEEVDRPVGSSGRQCAPP